MHFRSDDDHSRRIQFPDCFLFFHIVIEKQKKSSGQCECMGASFIQTCERNDEFNFVLIHTVID